jgi:hypothetical protein
MATVKIKLNPGYVVRKYDLDRDPALKDPRVLTRVLVERAVGGRPGGRWPDGIPTRIDQQIYHEIMDPIDDALEVARDTPLGAEIECSGTALRWLVDVVVKREWPVPDNWIGAHLKFVAHLEELLAEHDKREAAEKNGEKNDGMTEVGKRLLREIVKS